MAGGGGAKGTGGSGGVATGGGGATGSGGTTGTGGTTGAGGATGTGGTGGSQSCPSLPGAPTGTAPLPSAAQLSYQRTEMTAFIHYGLSTYDGSEQCNPSDSPSIFNPTKLDATSVGQWATALKGAGFGQAMLVTKHSCGFTLWPSKYTDYSVKASPWMSGKGDVVQLFTDAMHTSGMRPAIYLSPWDTKYPSSKSDYITYFKNTITEVLAYGPAYEIEFDGAQSGTLGPFDWKSVFQFIKQAQPNILIWSGPEIAALGATPDLQWIGNENGQASRTTSSLDTIYCGGGKTWCPFECNISSHTPNWFWHPGSSPMALADMQKVYFRTVGMNCTLNFNVPPSQTGEFDPKDLTLLQQFGSWYSGLYKTNLLKGQPATADSTWSAAGFEAAKATDDDLCTYWAAASGKTSAQLTVTPASPITINLISIREAIELGERVSKYHVEIQQNGTWNTAPTDTSGAKIQGTVIGNRQLWQLSGTTAQAVRLVVDSAKDSPAITEFSVY
jgi:alpha-L-fucosidase